MKKILISIIFLTVLSFCFAENIGAIGDGIEGPSFYPPSVSTNPATDIRINQATLNGDLTNMGGVPSVDVWFEWGKTTSYGNSTPSQSKFSVGTFSATISGLSEGTTYRFRAVAQNIAGISYGEDRLFTTIMPNYPPTIISVSDSPDPLISGSQITFSASWSDPNTGDQTKLHICKTDSISGQTCSGGSWCDTAGWTITSPSSCNYTVQSGDVGTRNYYAFVCDDENACSSKSGTFTVYVPQPCQNHNVWGWAWSENIGWIGFSCRNCDSNGDTVTDTGNYSQCPVGQRIGDYGVDIDLTTGKFSGYAWSENVGWVSFAPSGPYPSTPDYSVKVNIDNGEVSGWGRALNYGDGWDGWIKLRDTGYGVSITSAGKFQGWAWGNAIIGWISLSGSNYGVETTFFPTPRNRPPNRPDIPDIYKPSGASWDHCSGENIPTLHWTYSDPDGDPQTAYEVEVDDNSSYQAPKFNHLVNLAATSYVLDLSQDDDSDWVTELAWDTTYKWRVRVKDDHNNWSDWSLASREFKTPKQPYPWSGFSWFPEEPSQQEVVVFLPDEVGYSSYLWTINDVNTDTYQCVDETHETSVEPHVKFLISENKVKLKVTQAGLSCESQEKEITAKLPLPEYKEAPPVIWLKKVFATLISFFNGFFK